MVAMWLADTGECSSASCGLPLKTEIDDCRREVEQFGSV
jgi:hypothetical protein